MAESSLWSQSFKALRKAHLHGDTLAAFRETPQTTVLPAGERFRSYITAYGSEAFTRSFNRSLIKGWDDKAGEGGSEHPPLMHLDQKRKYQVYSETASYCAVLFMSGRAVSTRGSLVVEMGTLSGASSRCLAAGLATGRLQGSPPSVYMAFDAFDLYPKRAMRKKGWDPERHPLWLAHERARTKQTAYDTIVWRDVMVSPVYSGPTLAWPGDIVKTSAKALRVLPELVPIELWSIDSAKSHADFISQSKLVWPRLRVGSIVHLMDFSKHQLAFWLFEFVFSGDASIAFVSRFSAPWSFVIERAPLDWGKVLGWCDRMRGSERLPPDMQTRAGVAILNYFEQSSLPAEGPDGWRVAMLHYERLLRTANQTGHCTGV